MHLWRTVQAEETGGATTGMSIRVVTEDHTHNQTQNHDHNHAHRHHTLHSTYTAEDSSLYFYLVTPDADILHTMLESTTSTNTPHAHHRQRRSVQYESGSNCGLRRWSVALRSIDWHHFIIQPSTIEANYCSGSCNSFLANLVTLQELGNSATSHSLMKYLYRSKHPRNTDVPRACCVPTTLRPTSVVKRMRNPAVLEADVIDRMIATGCGCI